MVVKCETKLIFAAVIQSFELPYQRHSHEKYITPKLESSHFQKFLLATFKGLKTSTTEDKIADTEFSKLLYHKGGSNLAYWELQMGKIFFQH